MKTAGTQISGCQCDCQRCYYERLEKVTHVCHVDIEYVERTRVGTNQKTNL